MTSLFHTLFIEVQQMTNRASHQRRQSVVIGALLLQLFGITAFAAVAEGHPFLKIGGNFDNPAVVPVHSNAFGMTYEELAAKFWQWEFSMPINASPVFDTGDCSTNQSGKVWFLGGSALPFQTT